MKQAGFFAGDPVPMFVCASPSGPQYHFDSVAGRYIVLCFFGSTQLPASKAALQFATTALGNRYDDQHAAFFGVSIDPQDRQCLQERIPGIRYFWDFDRKVSLRYGAVKAAAPERGTAVYQPFTLVLDPALRTIEQIPLNDPAIHNARLRELLDSLPPLERYAGTPAAPSAPVLLVPRLFEESFCRRLIALYEENGGCDSGFMRDVGANTVGLLDRNFKRRKDVVIEDEEIKAGIRQRIERRLLPEIRKAFQFQATHIERYIVACYDSRDAGFFRPHRDNTTRATAHRAFACTINLNAEDYDGGDLRFPEFGPRTYRAPTGGAIVFSCSLLHEATPVTKGRRYATLPFLYDAPRARMRAQTEKFLADEILDLNKPASDPADGARDYHSTQAE